MNKILQGMVNIIQLFSYTLALYTTKLLFSIFGWLFKNVLGGLLRSFARFFRWLFADLWKRKKVEGKRAESPKKEKVVREHIQTVNREVNGKGLSETERKDRVKTPFENRKAEEEADKLRRAQEILRRVK